MRAELKSLRSRPVRLALTAGAMGIALSACSQDASRFKEDPFGNPFASRNDVTHSVPARSGAVESRPLHSPSAPPPAYSSAPRSVPAAPAPAYTPQQASYHQPAPLAEQGWSHDGGTSVTLQHGETLDTLARRYGVPVSAILRANNFADASRVRPGTLVVIPSYRGVTGTTTTAQPAPPPARAAAPAQTPARPTYHPAPPPARTATPAQAPAQGGQVHVVNAGETLFALSRRYGVSHRDIAYANGLHEQAQLRVGQRLTIPSGYAAAPAPAAPAQPARTTAQFSPPPTHRTEPPVVQPVAATAPEPTQKVAAVSPVVEDEPRSLGSSPQFRWPVRGRIISTFGPKAGGQHNDGINVAVPEGTEIKAAEDGVVAYAGNELKGYGNLVLLRHADGWMTAYAHNSQLLVKRGDSVRRGQTIARAGQTGGVSSPQLHFEIRKGSTPVDPTQYLAGL